MNEYVIGAAKEGGYYVLITRQFITSPSGYSFPAIVFGGDLESCLAYLRAKLTPAPAPDQAA